MALKKLFLIYSRNAVGTFKQGFTYVWDTIKESKEVDILNLLFFLITPAILVLHISLLPITLTLGAGLKTLYDFFTRKSISPNEINQGITAINSMDRNILNKFINKEMLSYNAQSNSSKMLLTKLRKIFRQEDDLDKEHGKQCDNEKYKLALKQLGVGAEQIYLPSHISKQPLNESNQQELKTFENHLNQECDRTKTALHEMKKNLITMFMSEEHNNGKKLQQIIVNFFSKNKASPTTKDKTNLLAP